MHVRPIIKKCFSFNSLKNIIMKISFKIKYNFKTHLKIYNIHISLVFSFFNKYDRDRPLVPEFIIGFILIIFFYI